MASFKLLGLRIDVVLMVCMFWDYASPCLYLLCT